MKVMVIVKASPSSEAGAMPSEALLTAMGEYNQALVQAGIMTVGEGLKPSSEGVRVHFRGTERSVIKGPFPETSELAAGYWIWQVNSLEEAIEWAKKCPNPMPEDSDLEIRPLFEMDDFADVDPSGTCRQHESDLHHTIAMQQAITKPYLYLSGQCDEALAFYQQHLGATISMLIRFNESPKPLPTDLPDGYEDKVMHCEFSVGDMSIMASDGCKESTGEFRGFSLTLTIADEAYARQAFQALSEGGEVNMPLSETFWSPLYGQVTDKFGISWMIMLPERSA